MATNIDIALQNNDLLIDNGDFVFTESDMQHVVDTINAFPGWWKENPTDGVGLMQFQNSSGQEQTINRSIKINLQSDGYGVEGSVITTDTSGNMIINPNAVKL